MAHGHRGTGRRESQQPGAGQAEASGPHRHVDIGQQQGLHHGVKQADNTGLLSGRQTLQFPVYPFDDPVGCRRTGGDAHPADTIEAAGVQFGFGFHMIGRFAALGGNFGQPLGVTALPAPHDDDGIHAIGQLLDLCLPLFR